MAISFKTEKCIGVLSPIMDKANIHPFSNLLLILKLLSRKVCVIDIYKCVSRANIDVSYSHPISFNPSNSRMRNILNYIIIQIKISHILVVHSGSIDLWVFYLGDLQLIPHVVAKVLRKKTILILGGLLENELKQKNQKNFCRLALFLKRINLQIADIIIIYSPLIIAEWSLKKYKHKIYFAREQFVDIDVYRNTNLINRSNVIGYIGRLSEEKGIINLIKAIGLLNKDITNISVLIIGDGPLRNDLIDYIDKNNLGNIVRFLGWIQHDQLPSYLDQIKLLVLPSYSEGLPNIIVEAMASGTPVLAAEVGAIPGMLADGETGFLMKNNSPECIAKNIIRAMNFIRLDRIAENARNLASNEYSYESSIKQWERVINDSRL